jgi:hypothetical protein
MDWGTPSPDEGVTESRKADAMLKKETKKRM